MAGFYILQRGWQQNPAFNNEPFSRRDAWVWLIETANFAEGVWGVAGRTITLERGQLCRPLRKIAEAWQWDEARVRRFLDRLEADAMIARVTDAKSTVITICNYDEFQLPRRVADAATDANATHHRRIADAHKKEGNEGKESSPLNPPEGDSSPDGEHTGRDLLGDELYPSDLPNAVKRCNVAKLDALFTDFWSAYPGRGKHSNPRKPALERFQRAVKAGADPEQIVRGAEAYAKQMQAAGKVGTEFVAQATTFLAQERWRDALDASPAAKPRTETREPEVDPWVKWGIDP